MTTSRITTTQLTRAFGVTTMTLYLWRKGTATKTPLPFHLDDPKAAKPRVSFRASEVKRWAKQNGVAFAQSLDEVVEKPPARKRDRAEH